MKTIQQANKLFQCGEYKAALSNYITLRDERPDLGDIIDFNIGLTMKRLQERIPHPATSHANNNPAVNIDYYGYRDSEAYHWITSEINKYLIDKPSIHSSNILVSIVVPARNCASFIEATVESLLRQSYREIEIVVIDDFSQDDTANIVLKLSKKDKRVKYFRVNANLGTYFARSYGVSVAKGSYITFQDADDFSHEKRIALHLAEILRTNASVITSNYARFDPASGNILEFHGKLQHYGFITTFAKKEVFLKIGAFDLTSRGGDAEFSTRISRFLSRTETAHLPCPTYLASDMPGSLSYGEVNRTETNREAALSFPRTRYVKNFQALSHSLSLEKCSELFSFPMLRSPYKLPNLLGGANLCAFKIVGIVCTIPSRKKTFEDVFKTIESQVDKLYVYPDKYTDDIPDFLVNSPKVSLISTLDYPGLRDGAKFLPIQIGILEGDLDQTIIFTFDDDIIYPPDYVHTLSQRLIELNFRAVVGVHGAILTEGFENFRTDRKVFHFKKELLKNTIVDVLGTGTTAFRADLLHGRFNAEDVAPGMIDLSLAVVCRRNAVPMYCISRHTGWLRDAMPEGQDQSLWDELVQNHKPHTAFLKGLGNVWGQRNIDRLFNEYQFALPKSAGTWSQTVSFPARDSIPRLVSLSLEEGFVFRIAVHISSNDSGTGDVTLSNFISGHVIYRRKILEGGVSFLCNSTNNSELKIDLSDVGCAKQSLNITLKVVRLFDAASPKRIKCDDLSITAGVATYPPREECLNDLIESVLPQVDNLCLYLNRYENPPDSIGSVLKEPEAARGLHFVIDSTGAPKASGKFRWINREGYIFTLDDDICYPDNYFTHLIGWIEKLKRKAFVGVHGVVFASEVLNLHAGRGSSVLKKYNFSDGLDALTRVHLIGTGTLAFHSSLIADCNRELYNVMNSSVDYENANDECLAVFARQRDMPMFIVPRKAGWLPGNEKMKYGIFEDHFNDPLLSSSVTRLLQEGNPWPKF